MKKLIYIIIGCLFVPFYFSSCSENDRLTFEDTPGIYFRLPEKDTTLIVREDTIVYSFAFEDPNLVREYVMRVPVEITGLSVNKERKFKIRIDPKLSTAVEGRDYIKLQEEYIMPANTGKDSIRITVLRNDSLQTKPRDLQLEIVATPDFKLGIKERATIRLRFSDILEEPEWWDYWSFFMGAYGRKKHQQWLLIWGKTPLKTDGQIHPFNTPKELMAIQDLRIYFEQNPTYENGERVVVPKIY